MDRDGDRLLQLLVFNEEFLLSVSHQLTLITSLPFVHTARRSYRSSDPVNNSDCRTEHQLSAYNVAWTLSLRGRRSRNKVSVGEPAEGSFGWHDNTYNSDRVWRFIGALSVHMFRASLNNNIWRVPWAHFMNAHITCVSINVLVRSSMKSAAICDKHCDLFGSATQSKL